MAFFVVISASAQNKYQLCCLDIQSTSLYSNHPCRPTQNIRLVAIHQPFITISSKWELRTKLNGKRHPQVRIMTSCGLPLSKSEELVSVWNDHQNMADMSVIVVIGTADGPNKKVAKDAAAKRGLIYLDATR
ncbi:hypothetical protein FRB94_002517 [Tulasnella sp. JGI-2019a]|nr:hypothetical protein FRB93_010165 [Tulasnella sp. JGI-2019a]KAG9013443.1 hypothetical protein FRB94_002517 [Tulasnella sp. JGI-2019a]KAG9037354.1 hypothetical protein FRB95_005994 [Tulasnella sp. JGI-2019a]